jgi:hypothetical protein
MIEIALLRRKATKHNQVMRSFGLVLFYAAAMVF